MSPAFITAGLAARHGFFGRHGGVSTGPYASLNCSFSSDDRALVLENRALVAAAIGLPPDGLLGLHQVHGIAVATVTTPWQTGAGPKADAMVTATPGLGLGIITADCAPVLFSDAEGRVVGAAHAGWRGALAGILEATAAAMRQLGAQTITAAIGPCIHHASYEVSDDLRDAVITHAQAGAAFFRPGRAPGKWQFDLPGYCQSRLAAIRIGAFIIPRDTCADADGYFSYRRRTLRGEPAIGHQISVIRT